MKRFPASGTATSTIPSSSATTGDSDSDSGGGSAPADREMAAAPEPGSLAARVLLDAWNGKPAIVVASPPGAGKTHLIVVAASSLNYHAALRVGVACSTVAQVTATANRIAGASPGVTVAAIDSAGGSIAEHRIHPLVRVVKTLPEALATGAGVLVATTAKWTTMGSGSSDNRHVDIMFVDEAWQQTWARFLGLQSMASQFVLVGDPGQIPPIVRTNIERWERRRANPALPAPEALRRHRPERIVEMNFSSSRRLGPATCKMLAPFYSFPFTSDRPDTVARLADTGALPEISVIDVDDAPTTTAPALLAIAAGRAILLARTTTTVTAADGSETSEPSTVIVATAHRNQTAGIRSIIATSLAAEPDTRARIMVDTFDSVQGLEANCVVTVDPVLGQSDLSEHALEPGRLCVGLSRHTAHLSFVTSPTTIDALDAAELDASLTAKCALGSKIRSSVRSAASAGEQPR